MTVDRQAIIDETKRWIADIVIGLNLCPFARRPFDAGRIRYTVSAATDRRGVLADLSAEVDALITGEASAIETALLIHPHALKDFLDYNDVLDDAEALLEEKGQLGVWQIASFHPAYQFADTSPEDVENYTNRSPYPMLHLLREESITAIADDAEMLEEIPRRNIETLRALGRAKVVAMLKALGAR